MKTSTIIFEIIICFFILMGCSSTEETIFEDTMVAEQVSLTPSLVITEKATKNTPIIKKSTQQVNEMTPATVLAKQPTYTPTSTTRPTSTVTPYPTIRPAFTTISTPFPDLSKEKATKNLVELLKTNGGCELPCWWGIKLGGTHVDSIQVDFTPLGFDWYQKYEQLEDNTPYIAFTYITSKDGVVDSIKVRGGAEEETYDNNEAWRPYAIPSILTRLGKPEEVYVYYPFRFDPGGMQTYRLFLYYPDIGVEIDYLGKARPIDEKPQWARACPSILETDEINLFLYQPELVPDYLERTLPETTLPLPKLPEGTNPYDLVSWEQATESSLNEFWHLFTESEEGTVCFEFKTYWTGQ